MRLTAILTVLVLLFGMLGAFVGDDSDTEAWVQDKVNGNKNETVVTFTSGGCEDDTVILSLPKDAPVYQARLGVKGVADDQGRYPSALWLDVGRDGDIDWNFTGMGYGPMGKQTKFSDNSSSIKVPFHKPGTNNTYSFYLPKGAVVTSATMDVVGQSGMNDGLMIRREGASANLWSYSASSNQVLYRPKLELIYQGGGGTTLQPDEASSKDVSARVDAPDANGNSGTPIWYLLQSWTGQGNSYGFIEFDLSGLPPDTKVSDAIMTTSIYSYSAGQSMGVHEVMEEWDEDTLTWNNMPTFDATILDSYAVSSAGWLWPTWNLTSVVNFWLENNYPANVTVDMGMDGEVEYSMSGVLDTTKTTPDFSSELNTYLDTANVAFTDDYGNKFVRVPVELASDESGYLSLKDLNIEYDWTATVNKNPHDFNLTNELNGLMGSIPPVAGQVNIPLNIHSGSAGKLRVCDVNVTYNGAPKLVMDIPSNLSLDEDTYVEHFMDLADYFHDDYVDDTMLDYSLLENTKHGIVTVDVVDNHYLYVNSGTDDARDWNGRLTVKVGAEDDMGFITESNSFTITVDPVNDEPVRGTEPLPDRSLQEEGASPPLDLDAAPYFYDVEDDELFFWGEVDHAGTFEGENISVEINNVTKEMVVRAHGDFFGDGIPVRIHCDDNIGGPSGAFRDISVDVANKNDDPPVWSPIPEVHVSEGGRADDAFCIDDYVSDVDNKLSELDFAVISIDNDSAVSATIDAANCVDVRALDGNWTGEARVTLRATDDGKNRAETTFRVVVDPVNDPPVVTLSSPARGATVTSRRVVLQWEGFDSETPAGELTYNLYLGVSSSNTLLAEGLTTTSYAISVEDGNTYHWTVAAGDGSGFGPKAKGRTFSVNLEAGPRTTLVAPRDGTILSSGSPTLSWALTERPGGKGGTVTFDVYLGTSADSMHLAAGGLTGNTWTAPQVEDGAEYDWTVIPVDTLGEGSCVQDVWGYSADFSFEGYFVGLTASPMSLTVPQGSTGALTVTLSNPGGSLDYYLLEASMVDVPGAGIDLDEAGSGEIPLEGGRGGTSVLTMVIPGSTSPGTYTVTVRATSLMGGRIASVNISVEVTDPNYVPPVEDTDEKEGGGDEGLFGPGGMGLLLIVLLVVMALVMSFIAVMYRGKSKRVSELEGRRMLGPAGMVNAELAFTPGGPAAGPGLGTTSGAVGADRQLTAPGAGGPGAAGAGAAIAIPLALPKVATGGEVPASGGTIDVTGISTTASPGPSGATGPAPAPSGAPGRPPKPAGAPGPGPKPAPDPATGGLAIKPPPPAPTRPSAPSPAPKSTDTASGQGVPARPASPGQGKPRPSPPKGARKDKAAEPPALGTLPSEE
jgi:hypothetical protein